MSRLSKLSNVEDRTAARLTHRSLERGLHVLEVIAASGGLISLAEIARRTGLHRSTGHHLLQTLVGTGYLRQDAGTRSYELSPKLFQLTGRTWTPEQLGVIAQPIVAELARLTGEGASLAAYRDGIVKIVAKCDHEGPVRVVQDVGAERPIHATAVGKAIVAFLPAAELDGLLARITYERYTPRTIVQRGALEAELRRIRSSGYANDDEEHIEGIRCVAAPVRIYSGQVVASLCTLGPKSRMTRARLRELSGPLLKLAATISERLGSSLDPVGRRDVA
jgi:IclR family acetate operon transcriptional repressor